jgi:hypothetical protein
MNFTEEEKTILGQEILDAVSKPLPEVKHDHIGIELPFPVEEILQLENIESIQKLKLRMVIDAIPIFLEYPTLHAFGFFKHSEHYHGSITQVAWDIPEAIKGTEGYKNSKVNLHAFTHNTFNGKRHIKFIRDKENNMVSYNDIDNKIKETFSYLKEDSNSQLLLNHLTVNKQSTSVFFDVINWNGSAHRSFSKDMEEFIGKEFLNALNYKKMDEIIPQKENTVRRTAKI